MFFRTIIAVTILIVTLLASSSTSAADGDVKTHLFKQGDIWRRYKLYVPETLPEGPRPLVLVIHGGGSTDRGMMKLTKKRWHDLADRDGFYVAYPNAVDKSWDFGEGNVSTGEVDDLTYFKRVLNHASIRYPIDQKRIFATGISRGGMASYYLACNLTHRIRAVAPVAMNLPAYMENECASGAPVPIAIMMGNADPQVPYEGGQIVVLGQKRDFVLSAMRTKAVWRARNGCKSAPTRQEVIDNPDDKTAVKLTEWKDCEGGPVSFYEIKNGGHTWPSGNQYLPPKIVGHVSKDIDGSDTAWAFFSKF